MSNVTLGMFHTNKCSYKNEDYYWTLDSPYKLYSENENHDFYKIIKKHLKFKKAWQVLCRNEKNELFLRDDKDLYEVQVNTQDLTSHPKEVKEFLNNREILKISSPMATRKSNILEEVIK